MAWVQSLVGELRSRKPGGTAKKQKKTDTNELIYKTEVESQMLKTNLWLPEGKGGGINWEIGIDIYTLLYIK